MCLVTNLSPMSNHEIGSCRVTCSCSPHHRQGQHQWRQSQRSHRCKKWELTPESAGCRPWMPSQCCLPLFSRQKLIATSLWFNVPLTYSIQTPVDEEAKPLDFRHLDEGCNVGGGLQAAAALPVHLRSLGEISTWVYLDQGEIFNASQNQAPNLGFAWVHHVFASPSSDPFQSSVTIWLRHLESFMVPVWIAGIPHVTAASNSAQRNVVGQLSDELSHTSFDGHVLSGLWTQTHRVTLLYTEMKSWESCRCYESSSSSWITVIKH